MDTHKISAWISRQDQIDRYAIPVQRTIAKLFGAEGKAMKNVEQFLHGRWLGHPLHSILVHIPVGAWTLAAIFDLFGRSAATRGAADWAIGIGLVMAIPAMLTGSTDWYPYDNAAVRRIGFVHMCANWAAFILYGISLALRTGNDYFGALFTGSLAFACLLASGYLGGVLVYEKRVGVNHANEPEEEVQLNEFVPVILLANLVENTPVRLQVLENWIVVVKSRSRVFALADKCSHEGGDLSKGTVVAGCLECPWHATQFRLEDGQVVGGPGVFPQPVFDVAIEDGWVMVKAVRAVEPLRSSAPIVNQVSLM